MNQRIIHWTEQNQPEEKLPYIVYTAGTFTCKGYAQHLRRDAHDMTQCTILRKYTEARVERPPETK